MLFRIFSVIVISAVLGAALMSQHGYRDYRRLKGQIEKTRERVALIEFENQNLKRQADLFEKPTDDLVEREVRDFLGWVKPNELVYLEKSSQRN